MAADLEREARRLASARNHALVTCHAQGCQALGGEQLANPCNPKATIRSSVGNLPTNSRTRAVGLSSSPTPPIPPSHHPSLHPLSPSHIVTSIFSSALI